MKSILGNKISATCMFLWKKFFRMVEVDRGNQKRGEGGGECNQKGLNTLMKLSEKEGNKIIIFKKVLKSLVLSITLLGRVLFHVTYAQLCQDNPLLFS